MEINELECPICGTKNIVHISTTSEDEKYKCKGCKHTFEFVI